MRMIRLMHINSLPIGEGGAAQSSGERGGYRSAGLVEEELESILLALWETIGKTIKDMLFLKVRHPYFPYPHATHIRHLA